MPYKKGVREGSTEQGEYELDLVEPTGFVGVEWGKTIKKAGEA